MGSCEKPKYNILGTSRHTCGAKALDIDKGRWDEGPTLLYALQGVSKSETARRFGVNRSTANRYLKRLDESGSLAPKTATGKPPKLDECAMQLLVEDIQTRPWSTHSQRSEFLFGICGVRVSETTICRAIKKRLSHSRKKINRSY
jgi:transposase